MTIRFDYYRDGGSMFESVQVGPGHACVTEEDPTRWTEGYDFPALRDGRVIKEELPVETPAGMSALVFNTRRPLFADPRVRQALIRAVRLRMGEPHALSRPICAHAKAISPAPSSARMGAPPMPRERELLAPFADAVKPAIMDGSFALPVSDGSGENREGRREALTAARSGRVPPRRRQARQRGDGRARSSSRFWPPPGPRSGCC